MGGGNCVPPLSHPLIGEPPPVPTGGLGGGGVQLGTMLTCCCGGKLLSQLGIVGQLGSSVGGGGSQLGLLLRVEDAGQLGMVIGGGGGKSPAAVFPFGVGEAPGLTVGVEGS